MIAGCKLETSGHFTYPTSYGVQKATKLRCGVYSPAFSRTII